MRPKEKAQELVQRFIDEAYAETTEQLYTPIAKKAALIAVNEILDALGEYLKEGFVRALELSHIASDFRYWYAVKQEINNL